MKILSTFNERYDFEAFQSSINQTRIGDGF